MWCAPTPKPGRDGGTTNRRATVRTAVPGRSAGADRRFGGIRARRRCGLDRPGTGTGFVRAGHVGRGWTGRQRETRLWIDLTRMGRIEEVVVRRVWGSNIGFRV